jgi:hypothetical protein
MSAVAAPVTSGQRIALALAGGDVLVLAAGRQLGKLAEADAGEVRSCIERGWRFYGHVLGGAGAGGTVALRIYGAR